MISFFVCLRRHACLVFIFDNSNLKALSIFPWICLSWLLIAESGWHILREHFYDGGDDIDDEEEDLAGAVLARGRVWGGPRS